MTELCKKSKGRFIYLNLIEKIIFYKKSKFQVYHDEKKLTNIMKYLNDSLIQFFSIKETNQNLLSRVFYLIVDFISIYVKKETKMEKDDWYSMFKEGLIQVPSNLVRDIHVSIFHQLYLNLLDENMKVVCFIFILEKCRKKSNLDMVGGNSFFLASLDNRNPSIA
jgi:hypothetical protein